VRVQTMILGLVLMAVVAAVALVGSALSTSTPRSDVVTDLAEREMLDGDMEMLERMRTSLSPQMNTMISIDPMWVDPDMIRAQEQYQAQLDRMMGNR